MEEEKYVDLSPPQAQEGKGHGLGKIKLKFNGPQFYEKHYKTLLYIPLIIVVLSLLFLGLKYARGEELIKRDVSLTGGITLTVNYEKQVSLVDLEKTLSEKFGEVTVRKLSEVGSGRQVGLVFELQATASDLEVIKGEVSKLLGVKLDEKNYAVEITGSSLGKSFSKQLIKAVIIAFLFMAIVVLILFRALVPAFAVIFAAFADILGTFTLLSILDVKISTAGIAAFLMLIGYSVDTDILLTARVLKRREKPFYERFTEAMKTGLTMSLASFAAFLVAYIFVISPVLKEIFLILTIGLVFDTINTWMFNASILKIYLDKIEKN